MKQMITAPGRWVVCVCSYADERASLAFILPLLANVLISLFIYYFVFVLQYLFIRLIIYTWSQ